MRRLLPLALAAALLSGCATADEPVAAPVTTPAPAPVTTPAAPEPPSSPPAAVPSPVEEPGWVVGASPLPLRPDGYGQVLDTPAALRERSLPTVDVLPPPTSWQFESTVSPVSAAVRERMGTTWSPGCPVALEDLRYLTVSFVGFDGSPHTGELVVAASVADDVVSVFRDLHAARFSLEEVRLPTTADLEAAPTGDGNNTAAYVCRPARGSTRPSEHAYGTAIDLNPFQNPYAKGDLVLPELASAYLDRGDLRAGMNVAGGPAVQAFRRIGWTWGGSWRSPKDPMHFSLAGR